ncbi:MAG: amino acid permease [Bacteroidia bacterium]|nr:amino acid permease [Bacteroidia bacterium]
MSKKLNLLDSTMIVMGSMIGSGIFIVSASMLRDLSSIENLLMAWLITGMLTMLGALSYAELGAAMPKAGGQYIYLKEAYGKLYGFLYGWTLFTVIQTGTIAAVAVAFAKFAGVLFPVVSEKNLILSVGNFSISTVQLLGIVVIWILTLSNFRSVKSGALVQNVFTISKIIALVFVIAAGVYYAIQAPSMNWQWNWGNLSLEGLGIGLFAAALVGSIFSSDAWNNITFTAGEIDAPEKNLPRALIFGTGGVTVLYLLANLVYVKALTSAQIEGAEFDRVGTVLMNTVFGEIGAMLMAIVIMISTFGCINGLALSGARVFYAMAKDGYFLKAAAQLNKQEAPQKALVMQAVWTSLLTLSGSYGDLLDYVVFAVLIFYILTVSGVFVLRAKMPNLTRPYKVFAYPIVPALYIIIALIICISLLIYKPNYSFGGLAIVLLGVPVYFFMKRKEINEQ